MRRAELIPTEGPSACELLDSCVIACGDGGTAEALRADIVKTVAPSSDPRLVQRREQSKTTGLLLKVQDAHRASLRRNVTEFQLGSPSDESSWGSTPTPQKSPTLGIVRQRKFALTRVRWGRCSRSAGAGTRDKQVCCVVLARVDGVWELLNTLREAFAAEMMQEQHEKRKSELA